jgi:Zn-dependent protease with chaperone function
MLLDIALITLGVAVVSRSVVGALAVPCVIVVAVVITMAVIASPGRRADFMDDDSARDYLGQVEPIVARVADRLHIAAPEVRIIDDQALNALSVGSYHDGTVAYTSGLLHALGDEESLEAVTAHLVGRLACGDNGLAVSSFGLLAWSLELFDLVVMPLSRWLWRVGGRCLGFGLYHPPGYSGDEPSFYGRLLLWVFALALGLELAAAALALFVVGGGLALVGVLTLKALSRQRMRFADCVAVELTGASAVHAVLSALSEQPTELAHGGVVLQDLCFAGPRARKGYVEYTPGIQRRIAWLDTPGQSAGLPAPLAAAIAVTAALALLSLVTAKVPYGRPFTTPSGATPVSLAASGGTGSGSSASPGGGGSSGGPPGTGPVIGSSGPAVGPPSGTGSATGTASASVVPTPVGPSQASPVVSVTTTGTPGGTSTSSSPPPPPGGPPATPSGVAASADGQYAITVTWLDSATDATGFNIDNGCPVGSCQPGATLARTTGPATTVTFAVTPGSYQCFRVQAFNSTGNSGWSSYGCTQTPGFTVTGTQPWADTGVTVPAGIALKITASGAIDVSAGYSVGPDGQQSCMPSSAFPGANPPFIAPGLPCWSLVGRIGDGAPFEIGSSVTVTTTAGRLYLSLNDSGFTGNSGNWNADIKEGG